MFTHTFCDTFPLLYISHLQEVMPTTRKKCRPLNPHSPDKDLPLWPQICYIRTRIGHFQGLKSAIFQTDIWGSFWGFARLRPVGQCSGSWQDSWKSRWMNTNVAVLSSIWLSLSWLTLCKTRIPSKSQPQSGTCRNFGILVKCTFSWLSSDFPLTFSWYSVDHLLTVPKPIKGRRKLIDVGNQW